MAFCLNINSILYYFFFWCHGDPGWGDLRGADRITNWRAHHKCSIESGGSTTNRTWCLMHAYPIGTPDKRAMHEMDMYARRCRLQVVKTDPYRWRQRRWSISSTESQRWLLAKLTGWQFTRNASCGCCRAMHRLNYTWLGMNLMILKKSRYANPNWTSSRAHLQCWSSLYEGRDDCLSSLIYSCRTITTVILELNILLLCPRHSSRDSQRVPYPESDHATGVGAPFYFHIALSMWSIKRISSFSQRLIHIRHSDLLWRKTPRTLLRAASAWWCDVITMRLFTFNDFYKFKSGLHK